MRQRTPSSMDYLVAALVAFALAALLAAHCAHTEDLYRWTDGIARLRPQRPEDKPIAARVAAPVTVAAATGYRWPDGSCRAFKPAGTFYPTCVLGAPTPTPPLPAPTPTASPVPTPTATPGPTSSSPFRTSLVNGTWYVDIPAGAVSRLTDPATGQPVTSCIRACALLHLAPCAPGIVPSLFVASHHQGGSHGAP